MSTVQKPRTILVVEDEVLIALAHQAKLQDQGYEVETAATGKRAVDIASRDEHIDLVLMDIDLGSGMDGTEAAERILASRRIPIVFLTSHAEKEMVEKVKGITRYGYVLKSSGEFVLMESIAMAFELFEAHKDAERSRDHYKSIVHLSGEIVVRHAQDGGWVFVNRTACEFWGKAEHELLGDQYMSFVHPEDLADTQAARDYMFATGKPVWGLINRQLTPRGWRTVEWNSAPIIDEEGVVVGHQAVGRDITQRHHAQEPLPEERQTQERLETALQQLGTMFQSAPMGVILADSENRIVDVNPMAASLLGYDREQLLGANGRDLIHPDDLAQEPMEEVTEKVESDNALLSIENRFQRCDGTYFHASVWVGPFDVPGHEATHIIQFQDITERKAAEQKVTELLEEKEVLLREVYHRIKNDLFLVHSLLDLQAAQSANAEVKRALSEAGGRIALIAQVYQHLQQPSRLPEVDLIEIVSAIVGKARADLDGGDIRFHAEATSINVPVRLSVSMGIIANELITNAVKYAFASSSGVASEQPEIRVDLRRDRSGTVSLVVADNGKGFEDRVIRGDRQGYGLTIVTALAEQHAGTVELRNDEGAVASVHLPG